MGDIIIAWACSFYLLFHGIIVVRRLIKYRMLLIFFYPYRFGTWLSHRTASDDFAQLRQYFVDLL